MDKELIVEETRSETIEEDEAEATAVPFSKIGRLHAVNDAKPEADAIEDEPSTINFAEEDDSILDEETLRDQVSEMAREKLQNELSDRITRNVNELVRREIQRALASREFE